MTTNDVINALDVLKSTETDALIYKTINHELGYLDCCFEHNIEDTERLNYIQNNILKGDKDDN